MRVSAACSLVWGTLHLRESPRYHPKPGLWLEVTQSADPHTAPWEGDGADKTRVREAGRVGVEKGDNTSKVHF